MTRPFVGLLPPLLVGLLSPLLIAAVSVSSLSFKKRADLDIDGDGLIEINSADDFYYLIYDRSLKGHSLNGYSKGCPEDGCIGFELTQDIDLDAVADGVPDAKDKAFWDDGRGWKPVGSRLRPRIGERSYMGATAADLRAFQAVFEGNGHTIHNLYINRPDEYYVGLFGYLKNAEIRNLTVTTYASGVAAGKEGTGILAGGAENSVISNVTVKGVVHGSVRVGGVVGETHSSKLSGLRGEAVVRGGKDAGGLIGTLLNSEVRDSYFSGELVADKDTENSGGIAGFSDRDAPIIRSVSQGTITGGKYTGGMVGYFGPEGRINGCLAASRQIRSIQPSIPGHVVGFVQGRAYIDNCLVVRDAINAGLPVAGDINRYLPLHIQHTMVVSKTESGAKIDQLFDVNAPEGESGEVLLRMLRCPTSAENTACRGDGRAVYPQWSAEFWQFGSRGQLPAPVIAGRALRPALLAAVDATYLDKSLDQSPDTTLDQSPETSVSASPEVLASNKAEANTDTTVAATNIPAESPAQTPTAGGAMSGEHMFDIDRTSYAADDPSATALAAEQRTELPESEQLQPEQPQPEQAQESDALNAPGSYADSGQEPERQQEEEQPQEAEAKPQAEPADAADFIQMLIIFLIVLALGAYLMLGRGAVDKD
ncbi:MAG: hypothetical protein CMI03_03865 [Oceanospirillaceae bacterium]|uniref:hypothetical protein n=2 Tax=unclassified Thalassolituus TaxID=2624967 RepID=UPI000C40D7C2|nr:hypothetical protein [Thalassolituus sp. UBA1505]MAS24142.1 hypothetical protein [Oceanospirillaceae bacterium]MBL35446.1 hypothetical protein [Oceanospirillaceae bacterium]MBS51871.1 hypothetical protein [Oceanospirillaceae bacterium]|tara:strand:+ start:125 stop:2080 length:1956 start_codon:yes stop_codon:yes gene_type:complete